VSQSIERIATERHQLAERIARLDRYSDKGSTGSAPKPLPAKYCNPDNPRETWAGRGRIPRWMEPALRAGKRKEDFLIEKVLRSKGRAR
jgi:DNA-binding protein H-NS